MTVDDFYELVRQTLNRGSTLDAQIPHYIQGAVRQIEDFVSVRDMECWAKFTLTKGQDPVSAVPERFKEEKWVRLNTANAGERPKWVYLIKTQPHNLISREGQPERYWAYHRQFFLFDAKPDQDYNLEALIYQYTNFPAEGSGKTHWMVDRAPMMLHGKVMMLMSAFIREDDPRIVQSFQQQYQDGLRTLEIAEEFAQEANGPGEMEYWPDHIPFDRAFHDTEENT